MRKLLSCVLFSCAWFASADARASPAAPSADAVDDAKPSPPATQATPAVEAPPIDLSVEKPYWDLVQFYEPTVFKVIESSFDYVALVQKMRALSVKNPTIKYALMPSVS